MARLLTRMARMARIWTRMTRWLAYYTHSVRVKRYSWQTDSSTEPARLTRLRQIVQVPKTSSVIIRTEIVDLGRVGGRIDGVQKRTLKFWRKFAKLDSELASRVAAFGWLLACEQAPLFGQARQASRERASEGLARAFSRDSFHSPK